MGQELEYCVGQEVGQPEPDGEARVELAMGVQVAETPPEADAEEPPDVALEVNGFTLLLPPLA